MEREDSHKTGDRIERTSKMEDVGESTCDSRHTIKKLVPFLSDTNHKFKQYSTSRQT